jgi:co-chaperonin GroES (HSP10)
MTLRVLRDRVCVKRIEYQHPILAVTGVVLHKGLVVATGYGRRLRRKTRFDGMPGRPPMWFEDGEETGKIRPMRVKVGQVVEFSPREQFEFTMDGEKYVMLWENAIYGVDPEGSQSKALLWQQSAGYDRHGNFMSGAEAWQR